MLDSAGSTLVEWGRQQQHDNSVGVDDDDVGVDDDVVSVDDDDVV